MFSNNDAQLYDDAQRGILRGEGPLWGMVDGVATRTWGWKKCLYFLVAFLVVVIVGVLIYSSLTAGPSLKTAAPEKFFTTFTSDEPTRSWIAYTGTVPVGYWGAEPWGEAFPTPP